MKKIFFVFGFSVLGMLIFNLSACKKNNPDPAPQDILKNTWKAATVQSGTSTVYDASKTSGNTEDFSKYRLKFDGTNYTYTDVNGSTSTGTYTLATDNKTITIKGGALDGKVLTVTTLKSGSLVIVYTDTTTKIDRQLTVSTVPG